MRFIPGKPSTRLRVLLGRSPAVLVQGPRQCGKSTFVRRLFPDWKHVDLEWPADFDAIHADIEDADAGCDGRVARLLDEPDETVVEGTLLALGARARTVPPSGPLGRRQGAAAAGSGRRERER